MNFIGCDLHKKTIMLCVRDKELKVLARKQLSCSDVAGIREFLARWRPFQVVVEATASYEWFVQLVEELADRVVLAHPKKLRVIAESTRKTDKIDAEVLAEFLARGMIPEAYRPTPRQREHRRLVRQRYYVRGRVTATRNKIRRILSDYNADRQDLFSAKGLAYLKTVPVSSADDFVLQQLLKDWRWFGRQLAAINRELKAFAVRAPVAEREARQVLASIPTVGPVTIDVVVSELGDVRRFRSQKKAVAYAGLAPGIRASAGKVRQGPITKEGSKLLRWALVETAWRLVVKTRYWGHLYERLKGRCGAKRAIVALARRLLCVMVSMLQRGARYRLAKA